MKTLTIAVTDEQATQIEEVGRRQGISSDAVVLDALEVFLSNSRALGQQDTWDEGEKDGISTEDAHSSQLWFIGLGGLDDPVREHLGSGGPNEAIARAIWEDSFGGTRSWDESIESTNQSTFKGDVHPEASI